MRPRPPTPFKRALVIPVALAVSSLAPACAGKDDTTQTGPATDTVGTTGTTGSGSGSSSGTPTTTESSSTTTGELPDCPVWDDDAETCSSMVECLYLLNQEVCIVRCNYFPDQASCEMQAYCYWEAGGCYLAV